MRSRVFLAFAFCSSLAWARDANYEKALKGKHSSDSKPIPNIVHFTHGLRDGFPPYFHFHEALAIISTARSIKPDKIYMWLHNEPTGPWFDMVRQYLEIKRIDGVTSVFGRPIAKFAHRADVLRLWVLHEYGGIYLDIDVIALRPFSSLLDGNSFVLGREGKGQDSIGLCNAIMLSKPRAPFLRRWMKAYETFDGKIWNYHSVQLPAFLAQLYPKEVTVLDYDAFFWPLWNPEGLQKMYMDKSYDFKNNFAVHLWESNARDWFLNQLTPDLIQQIDLPFYCQLRRFLDPPIDPTLNPACQPRRNLLGNGIVGLWEFDNDEGPKVIDSSPNLLHGWAVNGTEIVAGTAPGTNIRHFRGGGDFIALPAPLDMQLQEFSLEVSFAREGACESVSTIAALQTDRHVVLVEGTCESRTEATLWLKVYGYLDHAEWPIVRIEWHATSKVMPKMWTRMQLTASAINGKIELWVAGVRVASGLWPPDTLDREEYLRNVWLGARPASPFPNPMRNVDTDFSGRMDYVALYDRAMSSHSQSWRGVSCKLK